MPAVHSRPPPPPQDPPAQVTDRAGHGHRRRRGEHGGRRPRVGHHQRPDAPGRACLGPPPALPSRHLLLRHRRAAAVGGAPPDVAVLGAVRRQPRGIRRLLQPPWRRPDLRCRARHERHHLRRHRCRRRPPRRGHARSARSARHGAHRPRRLGLHLLALQLLEMMNELWSNLFSTVAVLGILEIEQTKCEPVSASDSWNSMISVDESSEEDPSK
ncbi:hypothetical protein DAI22_05g061100 [Oryza sativa Japonica Group]|nr:hypothetical protein DAI22_05g061100 [Oryza sativa Japonica Group]